MEPVGDTLPLRTSRLRTLPSLWRIAPTGRRAARVAPTDSGCTLPCPAPMRRLATLALLGALAAPAALAQSTEPYGLLMRRPGAVRIAPRGEVARVFTRADSTSATVDPLRSGDEAISYDYEGAFFTVARAGVGHVGYVLQREVTRVPIAPSPAGVPMDYAALGRLGSDTDSMQEEIRNLRREIRSVRTQTAYTSVVITASLVASAILWIRLGEAAETVRY